MNFFSKNKNALQELLVQFDWVIRFKTFALLFDTRKLIFLLIFFNDFVAGEFFIEKKFTLATYLKKRIGFWIGNTSGWQQDIPRALPNQQIYRPARRHYVFENRRKYYLIFNEFLKIKFYWPIKPIIKLEELVINMICIV